MKWNELQPGDLLLPYAGYRSDVFDRELDPVVVLSVTVTVRDRDAGIHPYGLQDAVEIEFLNVRTASTFKENRYTSGTAALGYEIVRGGRRVG